MKLRTSKYLLSIIVFLLLSGDLNAQKMVENQKGFLLSGRIIAAETGEGVDSASVIVFQNRKGIASGFTNRTGNYSIRLDTAVYLGGAISIEINHFSYWSEEFTYRLKPEDLNSEIVFSDTYLTINAGCLFDSTPIATFVECNFKKRIQDFNANSIQLQVIYNPPNIISGEVIEKSPFRDIEEIIQARPFVFSR